MKKVSILGATGSVGVNTLDVIERHPELFSVIALTANENIDLLYEQCIKFRILSGVESLEKVASLPEIDIVMAAIVGAAGIRPTFAAAHTGKCVLLANKETLVMAGHIFMNIVKENHATLLPIDSEHNAVFQCLPIGNDRCEIEKIILTASGGPFLTKSLAEFEKITPEQACVHPNWEMGKKISVDSATMMNKGLELIEACKLFDVNVKDVEIVIHPQSIVHSLVAYPDGSVLAHMAYPDMRVPIAHALAWPQRINSGVDVLNLTEIGALEFSKPDYHRFPCLQLAYDAMAAQQSATTVLNAANEVAVNSFLNEKIRFTDISSVIDATLQDIEHVVVDELEVVLEKDQQARSYAQSFIRDSLVRQ